MRHAQCMAAQAGRQFARFDFPQVPATVKKEPALVRGVIFWIKIHCHLE
jgi:hypothetical protein